MRRIIGISLLPALLVLSAMSVHAQTLGGTVCPTNLNYGPKPISYGLGTNSFDEPLQISRPQGTIAAPEYSPVLMSATSLGIGAVGSFPVDGNLFVRVSIINLFSPTDGTFGSGPSSQGILVPVQFGVRVPLLESRLNTLGYSLYGEGSAGMLFGWAYPTSGSFINYSIPNSRFTSGASAYAGIGNSLRLDRYVGLYLNGGVGYFDLFSSTFMPQTRYLVPSISAGFFFNFI